MANSAPAKPQTSNQRYGFNNERGQTGLDRCVNGFDHHCTWLNNCIGTSNYRSFFLLMAFTVGMCIVQLGWGLYLIARSFYDASNMEAIVHDAYYGMNFRGWQVALFIYILLLLLAIIMLGELFSFHIVLVSKGMTTYEFIIASKDDNPNAHQAPSSGGARAALCRSTKVADEAIMRQKPPSKPKAPSSGGARAALCRSTKVADEAIMRQKPPSKPKVADEAIMWQKLPSKPKVSLNPCKAVFAHKLEGDMRTWGKDGKKDKEKDSGLMFAGVSGVTPGAYNHMGGHAPTELRSRTPRTPSPMELSSPRAPPAAPGLSSVTLRPESAGSSGSRSLRGTSSGSGSIPGGPVRSPNRGQVSSPASLEAARSLDGTAASTVALTAVLINLLFSLVAFDGISLDCFLLPTFMA
eukprot:gene18397-24868_t